jgi:NAD(P)-dependent dehydrogenase (short-subunit alcohol dehydrogenase family)
MAFIFVSGSADGLGKMAAQLLVAAGHRVVLHARSEKRAADARQAVPGAETVAIGDFSSLAQLRALAESLNRLGTFDAVIHNAAIGYQERRREETEDGLPRVFAINTLGPYVLTALMNSPRRLVYLSSGMHRGADASLRDLLWTTRGWNGSDAYAESKLHDTLLAFAVARRWRDVLSNAVDPGWVATKMGGRSAPGDLDAAPRTQVWLATSDDPEALVSGQYFYHMKQRPADAATSDTATQDRLLAECARLSGVPFPQPPGD